MREIKLRQAIFNADGSFLEWYYWGYFKDEIRGWVSTLPLRGVNIGDSQQYLGMNDKNGKEVFEGDIVAFGTTNVLVEYDSHTAQWSICADMCMMRMSEKANKRVEDGHSKNGTIKKIDYPEVIGNIFENPELKSKVVTNYINGEIKKYD